MINYKKKYLKYKNKYLEAKKLYGGISNEELCEESYSETIKIKAEIYIKQTTQENTEYRRINEFMLTLNSSKDDLEEQIANDCQSGINNADNIEKIILVTENNQDYTEQEIMEDISIDELNNPNSKLKIYSDLSD